MAAGSPPAPVPATRSLVKLSAAADGCRACELYVDATQTVFGAGPKAARIVLVGEQPGDVEDREGEPFVGPAGRVLDRALAAAELARDQLYLTNAVKHFRWRPAPRGKRRIHQTPAVAQVNACRPWLAAELSLIRPAVVVALGATASASLYGPGFRLTQHRGERLDWPPAKGAFADSDLPVEFAFATIHPSAVLRGGDSDRQALFDGFVHDLRAVAAAL